MDVVKELVALADKIDDYLCQTLPKMLKDFHEAWRKRDQDGMLA